MQHIVLMAHNEFLRVHSAINIMHSIPTSPSLEVTTRLKPRLSVLGFVSQLCLEPRPSVPDFVPQLWKTFGFCLAALEKFYPKLRDKIWNGEPEFEFKARSLPPHCSHSYTILAS